MRRPRTFTSTSVNDGQQYLNGGARQHLALPAPRLVEEEGIILLVLEGYPMVGEGTTVPAAVAALIPELRAFAYDWPAHRAPPQARELVRFISLATDAQLAGWLATAT